AVAFPCAAAGKGTAACGNCCRQNGQKGDDEEDGADGYAAILLKILSHNVNLPLGSQGFFLTWHESCLIYSRQPEKAFFASWEVLNEQETNCIAPALRPPADY